MKKITAIVVFLCVTSCAFQYISFNSARDKLQAVKVGGDYFQNLKYNKEITNYNLISVESAALYIGKSSDTLKEVYGLIYEIENNNKTKKVYVRIKKTGTKLDVKTETLF